MIKIEVDKLTSFFEKNFLIFFNKEERVKYEYNGFDIYLEDREYIDYLIKDKKDIERWSKISFRVKREDTLLTIKEVIVSSPLSLGKSEVISFNLKESDVKERLTSYLKKVNNLIFKIK